MIEEDNKDLVYIPFHEAEKPSREGYYCLYRARWWIVHKDKGLIMYKGRYPQCNTTKELAKGLKGNNYPWAKCIFIDNALVPVELEEQH